MSTSISFEDFKKRIQFLENQFQADYKRLTKEALQDPYDLLDGRLEAYTFFRISLIVKSWCEKHSFQVVQERILEETLRQATSHYRSTSPISNLRQMNEIAAWAFFAKMLSD